MPPAPAADAPPAPAPLPGLPALELEPPEPAPLVTLLAPPVDEAPATVVAPAVPALSPAPLFDESPALELQAASATDNATTHRTGNARGNTR